MKWRWGSQPGILRGEGGKDSELKGRGGGGASSLVLGIAPEPNGS